MIKNPKIWAAAVGVALTAACVPVGVGVEYDDSLGYPPEAYIATATPYYYEGYPYYYYGDHWYRRDGYGWHGFRSEPTYLHSARPVASVRVNYGRGAYYGHAAYGVGHAGGMHGGGGGHHR